MVESNDHTVVAESFSVGAMVLPFAWHADLVTSLGFSFIWIDLEHGWYTGAEIQSLSLLARRQGAASVVRVPQQHLWQAGKILESGADIIMVPQVDSAEQAQAAVRYTRYAPLGTRGYSGIGEDASYGLSTEEHLSTAASVNRVIVQIESTRGVAAAGEIASVEGLRAIMVGRADLAVDAACSADLSDSRMDSMIRRVAQEAGERNVTWGSLIRQSSEIPRLQSLRAGFGVYGSPIPRIAQVYRLLAEDCGLDPGTRTSLP
jgi:2-keto-3-deoxy-L-rhamnonate aldolase RhmA